MHANWPLPAQHCLDSTWTASLPVCRQPGTGGAQVFLSTCTDGVTAPWTGQAIYSCATSAGHHPPAAAPTCAPVTARHSPPGQHCRAPAQTMLLLTNTQLRPRVPVQGTLPGSAAVSGAGLLPRPTGWLGLIGHLIMQGGSIGKVQGALLCLRRRAKCVRAEGRQIGTGAGGFCACRRVLRAGGRLGRPPSCRSCP